MKHKILTFILLALSVMQAKAALRGDEGNVVTSNTANATVTFSQVGDYPWYWDARYGLMARTDCPDVSDIEISIDAPEDCVLSISSSERIDDENWVSCVIDGNYAKRSHGVYSGFLAAGKHKIVFSYTKYYDSDYDEVYLTKVVIQKRSEWDAKNMPNVRNVITTNTVNASVTCSAIGMNPWIWDTDNNRLRSNYVGNSDRSDLKVIINVPEDAYMCFDYLVSSEYLYDYGVIRLDGSQLVYNSGLVTGKCERFLAKGSHELTLDYHTDPEDSDNENLTAISNLILKKKSEWEAEWSANISKGLYRNNADATISFVNNTDNPEETWQWSGTGTTIKSAVKDRNHTSDMDVVIDANEEISISFNYRFEGSVSYLKVKIDGELVLSANKEGTGGPMFEKILPAGKHVVNFCYTYDSSDPTTGDCGKVGMLGVYTTNIAKGTCNENINWVIDREGTLRVSGTGAMPDYEPVNLGVAPWNSAKGAIKKIVIGDGITHIGNNAFFQCFYVTAAELANTVTSIGYQSFLENIEMESIVLSQNLQSIGEYAFSNCWELKEVVLPKSVTTIDDDAFISCTGMKKLVIEGPVSSLNNRAFNYCTGLEEVYCYAKMPFTIGDKTFSASNYIPATCKLFVPHGSKSAYAAAEGWNVFASITENHFDMDQETPVDLTISSAMWSTLILPYEAAVPTGLTVYSCNSSADGLLTLEEQNKIKANTPYVVFGEPDTYHFSGVGSAWEDTYTDGWFTGAYVDAAVPENSYILAKVSGVVGFYKVTGDNVGKAKVAPFRCYLTPDAGDPVKAFYFEGMETAITEKNIDNAGEVSIYDLNGRKLSAPRKGINIINGVKVIVK